MVAGNARRGQDDPPEGEEFLDDPVERLLECVGTEPEGAVTEPSAMRAAGELRLGVAEQLVGSLAVVRGRNEPQPRKVRIAPELEPELLKEAIRDRQLVVLEQGADGRESIVAVLVTRRPSVLRLVADELELTARRSLRLRSGRAGMVLREDGNVELVGSRISAASRGVFRLVGRMLRLN